MPIGILGGTFDPVHNAHLAIALAALQQLRLSALRWIPTGSPVHRAAPVASAEHRLAMLSRALKAEPRFAIDTRELAPGASGYTYDTLAALRSELGHAVPMVLLMGADQAAKFNGWHRWRELFGLVHIGVFARPDPSLSMPQAVREEFERRRVPVAGDWRERPAGAVLAIDWTPLPVSASAIRKRLARGEPAADALSAAVLQYIEQHRLYQEKP